MVKVNIHTSKKIKGTIKLGAQAIQKGNEIELLQKLYMQKPDS